MICSHRWEAPRQDVPDSVPVQHVCSLPAYHDEPHQCPCGAEDE